MNRIDKLSLLNLPEEAIADYIQNYLYSNKRLG